MEVSSEWESLMVIGGGVKIRCLLIGESSCGVKMGYLGSGRIIW